MKKNISINISGIIFHIEEDAYEKLREYLESINSYFSNFEGSQEIIADIESRIAEIFLSKLNEEKQIITNEDVDSLIATMGSIKDFQAVEDPELTEEKTENYSSTDSSKGQWKESGTKKMFRDEKRKLLGGVCAGMAHYFAIDPLWIRLITLILVLGSYGGLIIVYAILWVVLPSSYELSEDKKIKKMYRNPDDKVISGVSSGVAAYFGVDVFVIRLLFVIFTVAGGTGLLAYIILWIILPEAKTITDKVQMQGDPVTLSNIESSIKKSFNVEDGEENPIVKILLFPFRLIATILNGLGKALGPFLLFIVEFIRIIAGVSFIITGVSIVFSMVVTVGILLGVFAMDSYLFYPLSGFENTGIPLEVFSGSIPVILPLAAFCAIVIPSIFIILLGASIIAKRIIFTATTGWSLFAIFIISSIILAINVPRVAYEFKEDGVHKVSTTYNLNGKTAVLELHETGMEGYEAVDLKLRGHDGQDYELVQEFEAKGSSRARAIENAQMIDYTMNFQDSVFTFDSNVKFKEDGVFRVQQLDMVLYIPYNQPFMISEDMRHILRDYIYDHGYQLSDLEDNIWMFDPKGKLLCTTCPDDDRYDDTQETDDEIREIINAAESESTEYDKEYTFSSGFHGVDAEGAFIINIVKSDSYKVGVNAKSKYLKDIDVYVDNGVLSIDYYGNKKFKFRESSRNDVEITVFTDKISDIELKGASKLYLSGFKERKMNVDMQGASYARLSDMEIDDMDIDLTGASRLSISGSGNSIEADLTGASHLDADNFKVSNGKISAHGASSAKAYVTERLEIEESLAGNVDHHGGANVSTERN